MLLVYLCRCDPHLWQEPEEGVMAGGGVAHRGSLAPEGPPKDARVTGSEKVPGALVHS